MTPNPETIKEKMYESDNIKNILHIKKNISKFKTNDKLGEEFTIHVMDKVLKSQYVRVSLKVIKNKKKSPKLNNGQRR